MATEAVYTLAQTALAAQLAEWLAPYSKAPAIPLTGAPRPGIVRFSYPMGWRVQHIVQLDPVAPEALAIRTRAYTERGLDTTWWLGPAANSSDNQQWLLETQGLRGEVEFNGPLAEPHFALYACPPVRESGGWRITTETLVTDVPDTAWNDYVVRWKHTALVRYLELWERLHAPAMLRGLAGTPALQRSISGMIGMLNVPGALRKDGAAWVVGDWAGIYPEIARWPATAIAAARALAFAQAGKQPPERGAKPAPAPVPTDPEWDALAQDHTVFACRPTAAQAKCRSCGAPVFWRVFEATGRRAPLDAVPDPKGNCRLLAGDRYEVLPLPALAAPDDVLYTNHFQTCPDRDQWGHRATQPKEMHA